MQSQDIPSDQPARRVAFVQSSWHESLTERCRSGFMQEISALGIPASNVDLFRVPGAFEIPLLAKRAIGSGRYDAVVAAALVVDGGIYRHEFVAETVVASLMQAQLEGDVPVISVVLTPHHFHEHQTHLEFFGEHLQQKGEEAARACVGALGALDELATAVAA